MMVSKIIIALLMSCMAYAPVMLQAQDSPVEHMDYLTTREANLSKKYLSYMSEVAHGNRARKMEKRRQDLITEIRKSLGDATRLRPYKGDASLRDAYKAYWDVLLKVFTEDYHKIVNMEEIAEQSYDNMEAYLLAQEKAGEVLHQAHANVEPVFKAFAEKNNIKLIDTDTKLDKKLRQVGNVNNYYHQLYLIYFKSYKQDMYVWDAFNRKDINGLEQNKNTLLRFADEGLLKLDTIKPYKGDGSMLTACRKVLQFHKSEAEKHIPLQSDFLLNAIEFEKVKKAFDAKPAAKRTQTDIDNYNTTINAYNKMLTGSNKSLQEINSTREKVLNNWEITSRRFMELHVPRG